MPSNTKTRAWTGRATAFLYAIHGDPKDAVIGQRWLLGKYGEKARWTVRAAARFNSDFFKGGRVGIPEIYYDIDLSGSAEPGLADDLKRRKNRATGTSQDHDGVCHA
jgi:hypothetical protein